jgi:hypothetical protein
LSVAGPGFRTKGRNLRGGESLFLPRAACFWQAAAQPRAIWGQRLSPAGRTAGRRFQTMRTRLQSNIEVILACVLDSIIIDSIEFEQTFLQNLNSIKVVCGKKNLKKRKKTHCISGSPYPIPMTTIDASQNSDSLQFHRTDEALHLHRSTNNNGHYVADLLRAIEFLQDGAEFCIHLSPRKRRRNSEHSGMI